MDSWKRSKRCTEGTPGAKIYQSRHESAYRHLLYQDSTCTISALIWSWRLFYSTVKDAVRQSVLFPAESDACTSIGIPEQVCAGRSFPVTLYCLGFTHWLF